MGTVHRSRRPDINHLTDGPLGPYVGPMHPIVSTHPETRANSLFLGRRFKHYVNGLELEESDRVLDELWAHAT